MILDLKKGPFERSYHIIFRSFLEQQDLFAFGSFASLLSVLTFVAENSEKQQKNANKIFK
jgi:hypothetical protein